VTPDLMILTRAVRLICALLNHYVPRMETSAAEKSLTGIRIATADSSRSLITQLKVEIVAFNVVLSVAHMQFP
jgi:hypothetical protein